MQRLQRCKAGDSGLRGHNPRRRSTVAMWRTTSRRRSAIYTWEPPLTADEPTPTPNTLSMGSGCTDFSSNSVPTWEVGTEQLRMDRSPQDGDRSGVHVRPTNPKPSSRSRPTRVAQRYRRCANPLKKEALLLSKQGSIIPATSYSPTELPLQYHRL